VSYRRSKPLLPIFRLEDLGPSLRDLRKSQEVGIYDAAAAMGSTHGTQVTAWETGRIKPGTTKLVELLGVYGYVVVLMDRNEAVELLAERVRRRSEPA
jgi:hypothetical protein